MISGWQTTIRKCPRTRGFLQKRLLQTRCRAAALNGSGGSSPVTKMPSSEWEGVESLSQDIGNARRCLQAAETVGSVDVARALEQEIADMQQRQGELRAVIANSVLAREGEAVWKQLTPADVEQARQGLLRQRAETLARHAPRALTGVRTLTYRDVVFWRF